MNSRYRSEIDSTRPEFVTPQTNDTLRTQHPVELPKMAPPTRSKDLGTFGGYHVVRLIGHGGMGAVYEAFDPSLHRTVALKVLLPMLCEHAPSRDRFLAEGRAVAAVAHDNVVTVHQVGECQGVPYLVMEYLTGQSLDRVVAHGPLPAAEVVRIGRELAGGLAAAHDAGVIHRDVKPENALLDARTRRAKLLDFGLALRGDEPLAVSPTGGTPGHMSPEQLRGDPLDPRTDLFSLGVLLYHLASGKKPFHGSSVKDLCHAILCEDPKPLLEVNPHLPPDLAALIHRLLAKSLAARPASADVVSRELAAVEARLPAAEPLPLDPPADEAASAEVVLKVVDVKRRRWAIGKDRLLWVCLVALVVSLALGAGLGLALRGPGGVAHSTAANEKATTPAVDEPQPWFVPLFNGRDLSGWRGIDNKTDQWAVTAGVLVGTPKPPKPPQTKPNDQVLMTDREFTDYDLRLEYRWREKGGHTNVFLWAVENKDPKAASPVTGLRLNLGDDDHFKQVNGRDIGPRYRTGGIEGIRCPTHTPNKPIGEWNAMRVLCVRHRLTVELNGAVTFNEDLRQHEDKAATEPELARAMTRSKGAVALTTHLHRAIEFRNIRVHDAPPAAR